MEKEELLSLAGVVALLVVGDADASEEDELSEPVSDGVVVPLAESEMVYPVGLTLPIEPRSSVGIKSFPMEATQTPHRPNESRSL